MGCEDCKFANWDFTAYLEVSESRFGIPRYISVQFDFYCAKHDEFHLADDQPENCKGECGTNNCLEIAQEYYALEKKVKKAVKTFNEHTENINIYKSDYIERLSQFISQHCKDIELTEFQNFKYEQIHHHAHAK